MDTAWRWILYLACPCRRLHHNDKYQPGVVKR